MQLFKADACNVCVKSDCHQTVSVIPLATGDEVIKFLEGQRSRSVGSYVPYWTPF